mgnify:CR=1 FL=1|tara:strand:- start:719 stop:1876 length:1158 start_codon:yes stop_codon:yes gene_type:complete
MPKKRIAVIGAGNAGCISALHFYYYAKDYYDIRIYHSPYQHPIEKVGQGTTITPTLLISQVLGSNWYAPENPIGATFKTGILYEGWGKKQKEIFHPFPMSTMSMHYVPQKLSDTILKSGLFDIKEKTINDAEKEIDADIIIDCRGRHNRDKDNYEPLINPLNSCLLYRKNGRDPNLIYTRTVTTPHGWTFVVPNNDSVSYGYLYNNLITTQEEATEDFLERFELPEIECNLNFENYIAKNVYVGERTILNGNKCGFVEPLEATSTRFYQSVCRCFWDYLAGDKTKEQSNESIRKVMFEIETFVLWHYQNGSKYDSPFWNYVKTLPFRPDSHFNDILTKCRGMSMMETDFNIADGDYYGDQWTLPSFKLWDECTTIKDTRGKGFGA